MAYQKKAFWVSLLAMVLLLGAAFVVGAAGLPAGAFGWGVGWRKTTSALSLL